jgi:hypothetical protein
LSDRASGWEAILTPASTVRSSATRRAVVQSRGLSSGQFQAYSMCRTSGDPGRWTTFFSLFTTHLGPLNVASSLLWHQYSRRRGPTRTGSEEADLEPARRWCTACMRRSMCSGPSSRSRGCGTTTCAAKRTSRRRRFCPRTSGKTTRTRRAEWRPGGRKKKEVFLAGCVLLATALCVCARARSLSTERQESGEENRGEHSRAQQRRVEE